MSTSNPALFIVGCPRSGTTLLQRMLDAHPRLTVANDTHIIPRGVPDWKPGDPDPTLTRERVDAVREYRRFDRLGVPEAAADEAARSAATYGEFMSGLYDALARQHGMPLAGEKTPDYVRHLPLLHTLFPAARVVHIIRDGRDVALSTLDWACDGKGPSKFGLWAEEPVAVCALWWRWQVATGRRDGHALGPDLYHEVGYERLTESTASTLRDVAEFLDLPDDDAMASFAKGRTKHNPKLSAKSAWLPATTGLRDWRTEMSERDIGLFEALVGDFLEEAGYERASSTVSPAVARVAAHCRWWWESKMARRKFRGHTGEARLTCHPPGYEMKNEVVTCSDPS